MSNIPRDPALDSTFAMMREGYEFIWNRCKRFESDLFETRIMGRRTVCIHGPRAAQLFYDNEKFQRAGALPRRVLTTLFGKNAVQTLDDEAHFQRKGAFLAIMTPANMELLTDLTVEQWRAAIHRWQKADSVVLFEEARTLLTSAVCAWAGVPLSPAEAPRRARQLSRLVDGFGGVGPRVWKGKLARFRLERWMAGLISDVRSGAVSARTGSALAVMANLRDAGGQLVDARTAGIELLNIIRPTTAVAWYVAFAALALHQNPLACERIAQEEVGAHAGTYTDLFTQEVRRFYPFTPFLGAKVRTAFDWQDHHFEPGALVLLDVYGANRDPRLWREPNEFRPERFEQWQPNAYDFIPQGGGSRTTGHRCPGEWITMHNIALALHFLTRCVRYDVVAHQDLSFDLGRMPTRPRSGVILRNVRALAALDAAFPRAPSMSANRDAAEAVATGEAEPRTRGAQIPASAGIHP
jgi:fatty-acid peroxygenase